jgi:hypothetical protein
MSRETRLIIALNCVGFALLHALVLAWVIVLMFGESQQSALDFLEWPLQWAWPGRDIPPTDLRYFAFFGTLGSLFYGLVLGIPLGLVLASVRRAVRLARQRR